MTGSIDLVKVKDAAEVLGKLNKFEVDFLKTYLLMTRGAKGTKVLDGIDEPAESEKPKRHTGPDPRGRYKCGYCDKVLPTKRGRKIHEKMHDRQTAPTAEVK